MKLAGVNLIEYPSDWLDKLSMDIVKSVGYWIPPGKSYPQANCTDIRVLFVDISQGLLSDLHNMHDVKIKEKVLISPRYYYYYWTIPIYDATNAYEDSI